MAAGGAAPALLVHISIFLAMYAGAMLATGARLAWDPTTYVAARALLPGVYGAACAALPAAAAALLALAALAVAAAAAAEPRTRRALYLLYAVCTGLLVVAEVSFAVWAARAVRAWAAGELRAQLARAERVREHLEPLLEQLQGWHPLAARARALLREAARAAPVNAYVAAAAALALLLAQLAAVALALAACAAAPPPPPARKLRLPYREPVAPTPYERPLLATAR